MSLACYFDCDGTLLEFADGHDEIFAAACERAGIDADPVDLFDAYNDAFVPAFEAFEPDPYAAATAAAFAEHGVDADAEAFAETLRTVETERTVVRDGTRETLDALAAEHDLGVLTNGVSAQQRRKLERHDLFECFDAYVPSYGVGAHKPDPEIFAAARDRLPADEHLYVGDSRSHDVEPAREAGFLAVHVDHESDADVVGVRDVGTLGRVAQLL